MPGLRVETRRRLVEEEQLGARDERAGDRQPALHPARERVDLVLAAVGQLDELEQLLGAARDDVAREPEEAPVDLQVLADEQLEVEVVLLRDDAQPLPDRRPVLLRVAAQHAQRPGRDRRDRADHAHRRALARSVRPEEAERLAARDREVDPVDGEHVPVALRQAAGLDQRRLVHSTDATGGRTTKNAEPRDSEELRGSTRPSNQVTGGCQAGTRPGTAERLLRSRSRAGAGRGCGCPGPAGCAPRRARRAPPRGRGDRRARSPRSASRRRSRRRSPR